MSDALPKSGGPASDFSLIEAQEFERFGRQLSSNATPSLAEIQAAHLARRYRLDQMRAVLLAGFIYDNWRRA